MSVVQFDIQKIEQLLNSATTSRQRKMYQALLDKALSQKRASTDSKALLTTPETEKKAKTKTNQKTETKTKAKTTKKKKATRKSTTTEASTPTIKSTTSTKLTLNESDVPTQTEPSPSQSERTQHSDDETTIFQAKGALIATPYVQGDRLSVAISDRQYDLWVDFMVEVTISPSRVLAEAS